ncbi:hypothetical protein CS542_07095 [Pedobacter sp. IW39]|nr:hypothetical protein CS542_07095 [Pedobacter sp. IW39]
MDLYNQMVKSFLFTRLAIKLLRLYYSDSYKDKVIAEAAIRKSTLDWVVRAPGLAHTTPTRQYMAGIKTKMSFKLCHMQTVLSVCMPLNKIAGQDKTGKVNFRRDYSHIDTIRSTGLVLRYYSKFKSIIKRNLKQIKRLVKAAATENQLYWLP